ncbi:expressed protein [Cryptococcus deneoformans JEC21]|uniref:Expressed protein n=1 Tax=Cryptococcus deneoformans (strain JEC21 / ATCC MYA-565) TaxID=214684 RepID=Q5KB52_CRYD1|nr:expressed protein [Cryptococcus neoformans var. neoformans JEC21]AAW45631.2 expressed protein [Cryptococcus neoformans var. neoformans JEC21]
MAIPHTIQEQHPADPLLLLPIPEKLPPLPLPALPSLISAFEPYIDPSKASSSSENEAIALPVLVSSMRQITRNAQVLLNAARLGAAEAREELDGVDVRLREVEYERNRIREETERCMNYESSREPIDLPDVETFLASVDQSVLNTLPPKDDEGYEHALTILRLEHELEEILKREAQVAQLTKDRDAYIRAKKEIKIKTDAVDVHLAGFARTANAVGSKVKDVADVHAPSVSGPSTS